MTQDGQSKGILLAWVHPGMVHGPFMESVLRASATDRGEVLVGFATASSPYIPDARNKVVEDFLTTTAEWLLFLDYDVTFTYEDIRLLHAVADREVRPIVAGAYYTYWAGGVFPCWWDSPDRGAVSPVMFMNTGQTREIDGCGMGFTMIHRSVLERMKAFFIDDPWHWFGHDLIEGDRVGEDITFCDRAKRCGASIWGVGGVQVGHIKSRAETIHTFAAQDFATLNMGYGVTVRR